MRRLPAALLLAALAVHLAGAQPRPRKIFISVDMEGITGVVQPAQLGPDGFEYQRAQWMTGEVNAAIAAIRERPGRVVVCDSHGNGQSVLIEKLPDDAGWCAAFRGRSR
jgi:D-amino peptidase